MEFTRHVTESGSPMYHMYMPRTSTVSCGVLIKAGTLDENWPKEAGLAHALEHMVFHGTKKFPNSKLVVASIEDVGGIIDVWTSKEGTFFWQKVPAAEFDRCPLLLSEILLNPLFPEEKIKVEMGNIVQEIKGNNDDPSSFIGDQFIEFIYGEHPLSREILGTEKTVSSFTLDNFVNFSTRLYNSANFTFIVVGNVKESEALEMFNNYFPNVLGPANVREAPPAVPQKKSNKKYFYRDIEQLHMRMGYLIGGINDRSTRALQLFVSMIDGGMSFPLFQIVRDERGLCYEIDAGVVTHKDISNFQIYIGTDPQQHQEAERLILKIIQDSKKDVELLERAKSFSFGSLAMAYESSSGIMRGAAYNVMSDSKPRGRKEIEDVIKSITIEEIEESVNRYLNPEKVMTVLLKPSKKKKS